MNTSSSASTYQTVRPSLISPSIQSGTLVGSEMAAPSSSGVPAPNPGSWPNAAIAGGQGLGLASMSPELLQLLLLSLLIQQLPVFQVPQNPMADPSNWDGRSQEDRDRASAPSRDPQGSERSGGLDRRPDRPGVPSSRSSTHEGPPAFSSKSSASQPPPAASAGSSSSVAQQRTNRVAIHVMGPATVEVVVQDADDRSQPFPPKSSQITIQVQTDASSSSAGMAVAKSSLHPLIAQLLSVIHPDAERQKILAADAKGPLAEVPGRHGSGAQPSPKSQSIPVRTGALSVSSEAASDHPDALAAMVSPSATRRQEPSTSAERGQDKGPIAVESDRKSDERNGFGVFNRQDPTAKVKPSLVGFDPSSCIQGDGHASTQTQDVALDPSQRLGALQAAGQSAAAQAQRAGQHTPQGGPGGPSATWFFWAVGGALIGFCAAGLALLFGR